MLTESTRAAAWVRLALRRLSKLACAKHDYITRHVSAFAQEDGMPSSTADYSMTIL
jgi:hypothetical protein